MAEIVAIPRTDEVLTLDKLRRWLAFLLLRPRLFLELSLELRFDGGSPPVLLLLLLLTGKGLTDDIQGPVHLHDTGLDRSLTAAEYTGTGPLSRSISTYALFLNKGATSAVSKVSPS